MEEANIPKYGVNNTCPVCGDWKAGANFSHCTDCNRYREEVEKSKANQERIEKMQKRIKEWGYP